jgi:hypothetical protein
MNRSTFVWAWLAVVVYYVVSYKNDVLNVCFAWAVHFTFSSCSVVGLALWALARHPCAPKTLNKGVLHWVVRETQVAWFYMANLLEALQRVHILDTSQLRPTCGPPVEVYQRAAQVWGPMAED